MDEKSDEFVGFRKINVYFIFFAFYHLHLTPH